MKNLEGKTLTNAETADYIFGCYFTANYNQTWLNKGKIYSFARDLQLSGNNRETLKDLMMSSLKGIMGETFETQDILVELEFKEVDEEKYNIALSIQIRPQTGPVFDFRETLEDVSNTIDKVNRKSYERSELTR